MIQKLIVRIIFGLEAGALDYTNELKKKLAKEKEISKAYADTAKMQEAITVASLNEANLQRLIAIAREDTANRYRIITAEALEQVKELKKMLEKK